MRNLNIGKGSPLAPARSCLKNTLPGPSSRISQRNRREDWGQREQRQRGKEHVEGPLDAKAPAAELGQLDVQQRHPFHRAGAHAAAGDIAQGRDHNQLGAGLLQLPAQFFQRVGPPGERAGYDDCVGPQPVGLLLNGTLVAEHRKGGIRSGQFLLELLIRGSVQQHSDHAVGRPGAPGDLPDHVRDIRRLAVNEHVAQCEAPLCLASQPAPPESIGLSAAAPGLRAGSRSRTTAVPAK